MDNQAENCGYSLISKYIYDISGIIIPPEKYYLIDTRLTKIMLDAGVNDLIEFYNIISRGDHLTDQKIIDSITVNETFWFRDSVLWKCFERKILPGLIEQLRCGEKNSVRIWSAAASTGQEAYSIAMCIDNYLKRNKISDVKLSDFSILATDISKRVVEIAETGRYDKISMTRGLSEHYKAAYFKTNGSVWDIDPAIKSLVKFRNFNLHDSYTGFGRFDIIFCRYVLIYFSNELKEKIITKMKDSLADGGIFFTGIYVLYDKIKDILNTETYENLTYYSKPRSGKE